MKYDILYSSFLEKIAQKIPQKTELVDMLANMLCIGKEAVYRRLRKEVPFTFYEVMVISKQLDISLDSLKMDSLPTSKPFTLKLIEYINPAESDFALMEEMTAIMKSFKKGRDPEAGEITNILPQPLYVSYENVFRFYLLKWKYQSNKSHAAVPFKDIVIVDKLRKTQEEYVTWAKRLHAEYIFDELLFNYLVANVKYFYSIGLMTNEEVLLVQQDLLKILDEIDTLSRTGYFKETGKKVNIYISSINIDTNYVCISAPDFQLTIIKAFLLNGVASTDMATFEEVKRWMRSVKQQSISITEGGEKERVGYLTKQRKLIEGLSKL